MLEEYMKHNCTYIMSNRARTVFYVGVTSNLARRLVEHRSASSSTFCGRYGVVDVIYVEWFDNIVDAIAREKQLKGFRRDKKLAIVRRRNPRLQSLLSPCFLYFDYDQ